VLVRGLLDERTNARAAKDWARADAIRDQIKAAGIEVEDTPAGPVWTLGDRP
jgi:cysteinyl-tRNA synthetase